MQWNIDGFTQSNVDGQKVHGTDALVIFDMIV